MHIAGVQRCSLVDWPGMVTAVLFTPGCNYDCFYCHNRQLLSIEAFYHGYKPEEILHWLSHRRDVLDGVVISGGEATLQPGLVDFVRDVRDLGYPVKLDTNGSRPDVLEYLVDQGLIDYVAMDLKAPAEQYEWVCGPNVDQTALEASIRFLLEGTVDYEFRTTVLPHFNKSDLVSMARRIRGARLYVLQQFRAPAAEPGVPNPRLADPPHPPAWFHSALHEIAPFVAQTETRGIDAPAVKACVAA